MGPKIISIFFLIFFANNNKKTNNKNDSIGDLSPVIKIIKKHAIKYIINKLIENFFAPLCKNFNPPIIIPNM